MFLCTKQHSNFANYIKTNKNIKIHCTPQSTVHNVHTLYTWYTFVKVLCTPMYKVYTVYQCTTMYYVHCCTLYINVLQCEMYSVPSIPMYYNPQCAVYNPIYLHIYNMHCHESADHTPTHNYTQ